MSRIRKVLKIGGLVLGIVIVAAAVTLRVRYGGGEPYPDLTQGTPQILALDGDQTVNGHGDVVSEHTAWALLQQVAAG